MPRITAYRAAVLSFDREDRLRLWPDGALAVGPDGFLAYAGPASRARAKGWRWLDRRGCVALPGLIDAHCHLPQYPAVGADGLTLLPWLERHIFPLERAFRGPRARALARRFFSDLAASGTTTACVFTSVWRDSTELCFEEALRSGLRVAMGKVMMDRGSYDTAFRGGPARRLELSLRESDELCRRWHRRDGGRLLYAFTPRFAVSCSMELMRGAADLARRRGAYLQTHLAENREELRVVARAFRGSPDYTSVYERAGLLGSRTILAHGVWLSRAEARTLARRRCTVAHCPTSNAFLSSGVMDAARLRASGVNLALGSDVAAGPTLDLFEVMRQAVYLQRAARAHGLFEGEPEASPEKAFHMATVGGARALGLEDRIGTLEAGKEADFILVRRAAIDPPSAPEAGALALAGRLVYRGGPGCVRETFVRGRSVWSA
ncbi:MAG: guanine deaminase [Elusimicrobia bacterium]|nr:guanine deaminase [Elusimicrobiota bacterium]